MPVKGIGRLSSWLPVWKRIFGMRPFKNSKHETKKIVNECQLIAALKYTLRLQAWGLEWLFSTDSYQSSIFCFHNRNAKAEVQRLGEELNQSQERLNTVDTDSRCNQQELHKCETQMNRLRKQIGQLTMVGFFILWLLCIDWHIEVDWKRGTKLVCTWQWMKLHSFIFTILIRLL